jgi:hypothetical protein
MLCLSRSLSVCHSVAGTCEYVRVLECLCLTLPRTCCGLAEPSRADRAVPLAAQSTDRSGGDPRGRREGAER